MKAIIIAIVATALIAWMAFADNAKPGPFTDQDYHGNILTNVSEIFAGTGTFSVITTKEGYLPLTGGTLSDSLTVTGDVASLGSAASYIKLENSGGHPYIKSVDGGDIGYLGYDETTWTISSPLIAEAATLGTHVPTLTQLRAATNACRKDTYADVTNGFTMAGALDMGGNKITSLGTPTITNDAATKAYVDAGDALNLPLSGGTMSGDITMFGQDIYNVDQITGNAGGNLQLTPHTSSGRNLTVKGDDGSNSRILCVATPTVTNDAATKAYVDTGNMNSSNDATAKATAVYADVTNGFTMQGNIIMGDYVISAANLITDVSNITGRSSMDIELQANVAGGYGVDVKTARIKNVGTPSISNDAATKAYVDTVTNQYAAVSWSVTEPTVESASAITIQLKDGSGNNLSGYYIIELWTSGSAYGAPANYTDADSVSTGTVIKEHTVDAHWTLQTDNTAKVIVSFTRTTDGGVHVMYSSPVLKGKIYTTSQIWVVI